MRNSILTPGTLISLALLCATPASAGDSWALLGDISITESEDNGIWQVQKTFPQDLTVQADGFTISGYAIPIPAQAYIGTFLLVQDPDDCPFCGSSGYGPSLEVTLKRPLDTLDEGTAVTVSGQLSFDYSPETYQAVRLVDALVLAPPDQP